MKDLALQLGVLLLQIIDRRSQLVAHVCLCDLVLLRPLVILPFLVLPLLLNLTAFVDLSRKLGL